MKLWMCLCWASVKNRHDTSYVMKPSLNALPWIKFIIAVLLFIISGKFCVFNLALLYKWKLFSFTPVQNFNNSISSCWSVLVSWEVSSYRFIRKKVRPQCMCISTKQEISRTGKVRALLLIAKRTFLLHIN